MMTNRRDFLLAAAAASFVPRWSRALGSGRMPAMFFAHGAPFLATDPVRGADLAELAARLPAKPRGVVVFTPHVRAERVTLAATGVARRSFPRRFVKRIGDLKYGPPAADGLAAQVVEAFAGTRYAVSGEQHAGFNHTVWMGLVHMFPEADVPVVEVAMPFRDSAYLFGMGQALAPLRDEGVLVISSGSLTHNLATIGIDPTPRWASDFDQWVAGALADGDLDTIIDWRNKAPAAGIVHPDDGAHFNVMMFALGAAAGSGARLGRATSMHAGWEFGSFTTREYLFA